jgi:hypothetical protein
MKSKITIKIDNRDSSWEWLLEESKHKKQRNERQGNGVNADFGVRNAEWRVKRDRTGRG